MGARWTACLWFGGALFAAAVEAQQNTMHVDEARDHMALMARGGGYWVASNGRYATPEGAEPAEYRMRFERSADGFTMAGCMWGDQGGTDTPVFWRFFSGWDPVRSSILAYQVSPGGAVAVGEQFGMGHGVTESIQVLHIPGASQSRGRHVNRVVDGNTLDSKSYDAEGDGWTPRRSYTWVWRPSAELAPC